MERRKISRRTAENCLLLALLLSSFSSLSALSITVEEFECVYEYVLYEGDTVSGNFVVVSSYSNTGIDLEVTDSGVWTTIIYYFLFSMILTCI